MQVKQVQTRSQTPRPAVAPHRATAPPHREVTPGEDAPLYDSDYDPVELGYPASLGVSLPPDVVKVQVTVLHPSDFLTSGIREAGPACTA